MSSVNTKAVSDRRTLHLSSLDELLGEARRLVDVERAGQLQSRGNWTLGQTFGHLAAWIHYTYDGYPFTVPWFMRLLGPLIKSRVLRGPMPPGFKFPKVPGGTYGMEKFSTEGGLQRLEAALRRARSGTPAHPSPVFGRLTAEQWQMLHLRHAELHLGFFVG